MSTPPPDLSPYLQEVRRIAWRRVTLRCAADLALLISGNLLVWGIYGIWSGRGDLVLELCAGGILLGGLLILRQHWINLRRRTWTLQDCARSIAQVGSSHDPARQELREDIAAAFALAQRQARGSLRNSSPALELLYLRRVQSELPALPAAQALPESPWRVRASALLLLGTLLASAYLLWPHCGSALLLGQDTRPPRAAQQFWSALELRLHFPPHTQRKEQRLKVVTGQLDLPEGTRMQIWVDVPARLRFSKIELRAAKENFSLELKKSEQRPEPTLERFAGAWTVKGPTALELFGSDIQSSPKRPKHAPAFSILPLPDQAPQIELAPRAQRQQGDRESSIEVKMDVRDDFGLRALALYYQAPGKAAQSLPIDLQGQPRQFSGSYHWDLSSIPVETRSELSYWIEARDNDPRLNPKDQRPGKTTRSSKRSLSLDDARGRHQELLRQLAALRDQAVDLLAAKMQPLLGAKRSARGLRTRIHEAQRLHQSAESFLSNLSGLTDAMMSDKFAARSTIRVLSEIHARSSEDHEKAAPILRFIFKNWVDERGVDPSLFDPDLENDVGGAERFMRPDFPVDRLRSALNEWLRLQPASQRLFEDEIIRLDDLVDAELLEQLQSLLSRVKAGQKKLMAWLETLDPQDQAARDRIVQLEARLRMDMQRIEELRAHLREEVDPDFFNEDALAELAARMKHLSIEAKLAKNDLRGAKDSAQSQLDQMQSVQEDLESKDTPSEQLNPQERAARFLRKALAQLQEDQTDLLARNPNLQLQAPNNAAQDQEFAKTFREKTSAIQDTQLSRPGRRAFERARDALDVLVQDPGSSDARARAAERLAHELLQASEGAPKAQRRRLQDLLRSVQTRIDQGAAQADAQAPERAQTQNTIAQKIEQLGKDERGQAAMKRDLQQLFSQARSAMRRSQEALAQGRSFRAGLEQQAAQRKMERAQEELSDAPPPPPPKGAPPGSTQAQRDLSLRKAVLEALKKQGADALSPSTRAYYESLLEH